MDEFSVVLRARTFVRETGSLGLPPSVEAYVQQIGGVLRHEADLPNDEPGYSFESNGKHFICVNDKDSEKRRRFTACHEIAHIVLGLPSDHSSMPWWSYAKRPKNGRVASITGQARSTLTRENGQPTDSNLAQPSSVILLRARTPICASVF